MEMKVPRRPQTPINCNETQFTLLLGRAMPLSSASVVMGDQSQRENEL